MASRDQIEAARETALDSGSDAVAELIKSGTVDYIAMLEMLAQQYGMEVTSIAGYEIPPEVIETVKVEYARYYQVIPVSYEDTLLTVAMSDPTDVEKLDTLRYLLAGDVDAVIVPENEILDALEQYYPEEDEESGSFSKDVDINATEMVIENEDQQQNGMDENDETPIIRLVSKIIVDAYKMRASDIHL